ncbi:NAD(P)/FAD-dependent oxidoreductase [Methanonatronarchaeum sp. AMET6-2]|uniref:NAD(P)/FAD-dependent oxidoreductase n=1 Tax=Methanonatronarchaeum sp. AMET6-2 TaxID=2933293 RepID=UPI0012294253|nr:NAD(P)/FAD-dependent oxidoreductase [Methanonatronarchaeum sp. AMET6-2]RZN63451.1 MAG: NAD(P)/FAD-dependent oxidoreductase [Methanonatronarchaeia archaeon]UOY09770.1 NAD(P)/FAD-dependent oxidoreductase [Methanonatronarchaeum sp. AMET6-2]
MNDVSMDYDVVVIGGGPAGLTASIYTSRADLDTLVLDKGGNKLAKADVVENYFGFPEPLSGSELLEKGREQTTRFGTEIIDLEALSISIDDGYKVDTIEGVFSCEGLILATGVQKKEPDIDGLKDFEGKGVSYCVVCDGPLFRDKKCGVIGSKNYGLKEALKLSEYTSDVVLLTDGEEVDADEELFGEVEDSGIEIIGGGVDGVFGDQLLEGVIVEGEEIELDGLFVAVGTSGTLDFALELGIEVRDGFIKTEESLSTGLKNMYAAGDCTGGERQISLAVGEGTKAALNLIEDIKGEKKQDWG